MPALSPTDYTARITWLGRVVTDGGTLRSEPLQETFASFDGFEDEAHGGPTRPSCSRVLSQHPRGTVIRNTRQLAVISAEEMALIAAEMGLDALDPTLLGTSMVIEGIADFTFVPPSSRLQSEISGATIVVDMENRPCIVPGREIESEHAGYGAAFKPAAKHRRGVTAWVEREGVFAVGDVVRLHVPDQRVWAPLG